MFEADPLTIATLANDAVAMVGPPGGLPSQVPGFVGDLLGQIGSAAGDAAGGIGDAVSGLTPGGNGADAASGRGK